MTWNDCYDYYSANPHRSTKNDKKIKGKIEGMKEKKKEEKKGKKENNTM